MKITLLTIGATRTAYIREGIGLYTDRLRHYTPYEIIELPDVRSTRSLTEEQQKEREGQQILGALQTGDRVVLLDERGRELTSREFSAQIQREMLSGVKRLVYVVGGPYGFSPAVYGRADAKLSLSRMTFSHEMVRLFFTEQVYRAMTILRGEPYHHD